MPSDKEPSDRESLYQALSTARATGQSSQDSQALLQRAISSEQAREWLQALAPLLPIGLPEQLTEYLRYALLGVCLGFLERDLSPYVAEHVAIIPPLLEDIQSVYNRLQESGSSVAPQEFRFRAFDYGVHKAYYLDWTLYMSHEIY